MRTFPVGFGRAGSAKDPSAMRAMSRRDSIAWHDTTSVMDALPPVPLTVEGASVLHQMFRIDRALWREVAPDERQEILAEATSALAAMAPDPGWTALFSLLGHKGDI